MREKITRMLRNVPASLIIMLILASSLLVACREQGSLLELPDPTEPTESLHTTEPAIPTEIITLTTTTTTAQSSSKTSSSMDDLTTKITTSTSTTTTEMPTTTNPKTTVTTTQKQTTTAKQTTTTKKTTVTTTTKPPSTTTTTTTQPSSTKPQGRPINHKNMVDMINEERARIGNTVRVSYGDATLQKIADIRTKEQERLFGHTRPLPCPGCDYCHGEKDCLATEAFWIIQTYGEKYAQGGCACRGIPTSWTVEELLEYIKTSPGHYNQMFKAVWTKFAYGTHPSGLSSNYIYFNYGR